jgi:hypothetical protein
MNHTDRILSGNDAHFHEESGEFPSGNRGVGKVAGHLEFLGIAIE